MNNFGIVEMFKTQWRNYRPRSPRNAASPDEEGAQNFRTNNSKMVDFRLILYKLTNVIIFEDSSLRYTFILTD